MSFWLQYCRPVQLQGVVTGALVLGRGAALLVVVVAAAGGGELTPVHVTSLLLRQHAVLAEVEGHAEAAVGVDLRRVGRVAAEQLVDAVLDGGHHTLVDARLGLNLLDLLLVFAASVVAFAVFGRTEAAGR